MPNRNPHRGLTLLETGISLGLIAVLVSLLIPILSTARQSSYRDQCAANQRVIGQAWQTWLNDNDKQFPHVPLQPGWRWGGMRFSSIDDTAFPDFDRPLTAYLPLSQTTEYDRVCVCCPADRGIESPVSGLGTGDRTVFRSFGTSYRANAPLLDARLARLPASMRGEPGSDERGLRRSEISTAPSRMVLAGDPMWYEVAESTGRTADWHGKPNSGNLLFMDGSVRFMTVRPRPMIGPMVFDPIMPGSFPAQDESAFFDEVTPSTDALPELAPVNPSSTTPEKTVPITQSMDDSMRWQQGSPPK
jgi:prepilin-type processing-associated H-X9-DG protein